jgi:hypothetical protein
VGEARGMRGRFSSLFQTNPNQMQDVLVDRGLCLMQQRLRGGNLRTR